MKWTINIYFVCVCVYKKDTEKAATNVPSNRPNTNMYRQSSNYLIKRKMQ